METIIERTIDMGNNESVVAGVYFDGSEYLVVTPSRSKTFKSLRGAMACAKKWNVVK